MNSLNPRTVLRNPDGGRYEVAGKIGQGGFGEIYQGYEREGKVRGREVCLKVCFRQHDWHGEAFYGELMVNERNVVCLLDSFVHVQRGENLIYVLVFELMTEGTVDDLISRSEGRPFWSEAIVRREITELLNVLARMHDVGITHRDIKPNNVYVKRRRLVLGDFGISRMTLDQRHHAVDAFTPLFSPRDMDFGERWAPAADVFQVALLAATLLTGQVWATEDLSRLQSAEIADDLKCWIWHSTSIKARMYRSAGEAAGALETLHKVNMEASKMPSRISGQHVVLTGRLDGLTQGDASDLLTKAGAHVDGAITDRTTLVIRGTVRNGLSESEGRKLFAVRERRRTGQKIAIASGPQLLTAVGPGS